MTNRNLYIAVKTNNLSNDKYSPFAITHITERELAIFKENLKFFKQSETIDRVVMRRVNNFHFINNFNRTYTEVEQNLIKDIYLEIYGSSTNFILLTKEKYDELLNLYTHSFIRREIWIDRDENIQAFVNTSHYNSVAIYTRNIKFKELEDIKD